MHLRGSALSIISPSIPPPIISDPLRRDSLFGFSVFHFECPPTVIPPAAATLRWMRLRNSRFGIIQRVVQRIGNPNALPTGAPRPRPRGLQSSSTSGDAISRDSISSSFFFSLSPFLYIYFFYRLFLSVFFFLNLSVYYLYRCKSWIFRIRRLERS